VATDLVLRVIRSLDQLGIPYMLVGSYSSNFYGQPRMTKDADFVVQLAREQIAPLAALLKPELQLDPQMSFETVTMTMRHIAHHSSGFKIELFLLTDDAHDRVRFERRRRADFEGTLTWLPSAEDVVVTKLRWSKGGRRKKDTLDVEQILKVRWRELDLDYIRDWADRHNTSELFEQLLREAKRLTDVDP
jgi:hypothetical protein